ncbi:MAG: AglZ/HisF2 family acetamidino modification protein [Rhodothermales bacterium]
MLQTRVMPCLLLRNRGLVKTIKFKNASYVGDPINTVRIYNEKEVDELIFLDITATPQQKAPPYELLEEIASECFMPFTYGGGVRALDQMKQIFSLGVEKVAVNSYAAEYPAFIREAADTFGSQSIVASIDVKKKLFGRYEVYSHGATRPSRRDPVEVAEEVERQGAGEILLTSIDRDGTMEGYDIELISRVTRAVGIPVIACGGAGSLEDFGRAVREGGASAVAAGSMVVYQGKHRAVLINFPTRTELEEALG